MKVFIALAVLWVAPALAADPMVSASVAEGCTVRVLFLQHLIQEAGGFPSNERFIAGTNGEKAAWSDRDFDTFRRLAWNARHDDAMSTLKMLQTYYRGCAAGPGPEDSEP